MPPPVILQTILPLKPWMSRHGPRLPGLHPISVKDWLYRDEVFAEQLSYRDHLIANKGDTVFACLPEAEQGARELLACLLADLPDQASAYHRSVHHLKRPDGIVIETDQFHPLISAGRLVQEDFALLQKTGNTHHLVGGLVCFPAHWRLQDKLGKSLADLHEPVHAFSPDIAKRSDRIFTHLRPDQPLMRANFLVYTNPDLHQPASENNPKALSPDGPRYVRVERQTLRRLPSTGTIVFAIHTFLVPARTLSPAEFSQLAALCPALLPQ